MPIKAKLKKAGVKGIKKVAKIASKLPGVGGLVGSAVSGLMGTGKRKRRGFSMNRYVKKVIKAKLDSKLMKIKLSAIKGI